MARDRRLPAAPLCCLFQKTAFLRLKRAATAASGGQLCLIRTKMPCAGVTLNRETKSRSRTRLSRMSQLIAAPTRWISKSTRMAPRIVLTTCALLSLSRFRSLSHVTIDVQRPQSPCLLWSFAQAWANHLFSDSSVFDPDCGAAKPTAGAIE
jgi:hypothetical protein